MPKIEERFFNSEKKEWYLDTMVESDSSRAIYSNFFEKASKVEASTGKDMYDMDKNELESVFHSLQIRGMHSMLNSLYFCKRYIYWAKSNGYSMHKSDKLPEKITAEYASQFIFKKANVRYTREEVLENIKTIDDPRYSTAILCLFEGIRGNYLEELANLKIGDLSKDENDNCFARLTNSGRPPREIPISLKLHTMLTYLDDVKNVGSDDLSSKYALPESPFIFKKVLRKNAMNDVKINTPFMTRTIINAKTAFDNPNLVANDIVRSGVAAMVNSLLDEKENRILDTDILKKVGKQYNIGALTGDNNESYISYGAIKKMIDYDYIKEQYGDFEIEWENEKNEN